MSAKHQRELLRLLGELSRELTRGRPMPAELFDTLLFITPQVTMETVIVRSHRGKPQVLLTRRAKAETRHPAIWHVPGSFLRLREQTSDVLSRIASGELGVPQFSAAAFVTWLNVYDSPVGHFISLVYRCRIRRRPGHGRWFSPQRLPASVLPYQRRIIAAAV